MVGQKDGGMPDQITSQELEKAARNIGRISEFIAARRSWALASGADEALSATREAADSFGEYLTALMTARQIRSIDEVQPPPEPLPPATMDATRLARFTEYLGQVRQWFINHGDSTLPSEGHEVVRSIQASLAATCWAAEALLAAAEATPVDAHKVAADFGPVVDVDREARLILQDTEAIPLLQEFKGIVELTEEAKGLLEGFFEKNEIDLGAFEKRRLQDKVLRWIEGTPEGQVLVFKISGLHGRAEPYASYQPKENPAEKPEEES